MSCPTCDHTRQMTHCWTGRLEWIIETFGDLSREWCEYVAQDGPGETCMLSEGHAGPHVWTPDDKIALVFFNAAVKRGMKKEERA